MIHCGPPLGVPRACGLSPVQSCSAGTVAMPYDAGGFRVTATLRYAHSRVLALPQGSGRTGVVAAQEDLMRSAHAGPAHVTAAGLFTNEFLLDA